MWLNVLLWLVAILVVDYFTRDRHTVPSGLDHPAVLKSQVAYRRGSVLRRSPPMILGDGGDEMLS